MSEQKSSKTGKVVMIPTHPTKRCHTCKYGCFINKEDAWYCYAGDTEFDPNICEKAFVDIHRDYLIG